VSNPHHAGPGTTHCLAPTLWCLWHGRLYQELMAYQHSSPGHWATQIYCPW
jgi:hypothetical protein